MKKSLIIFGILLITAGCGAITRGDILSQQVTVKNMQTKAVISGAQVKMNGTVVGTTGTNGIVVYTVSQPNEAQTLTLEITASGYHPITITLSAKPGGGYIAGDVAFLLLGLVPGVVSLAVDGATGTWYTYEKKVDIFMNPSN